MSDPHTRWDDTPMTEHEWDGIREYDNPVPGWWLGFLAAAVAFSVVWWVLYPSWPGITGYWKGVLNWSQREAIEAQMAAVEESRAQWREQIIGASLEEINNDATLQTVALVGGRSAYEVNCVQCHGTDALGGPGYPNLADDAWIWGGTLADIVYTIRHGIRNEQDFEARFSDMPKFGVDGLLSRAEISDVASYVLSLSGRAEEVEAAARGAVLFERECVTCHQVGGVGNPELGAPNLTDRVWLYGGDRSSIIETITYSRAGVMPPWGDRLDEATIKSLAVYVHSLGGGQ